LSTSASGTDAAKQGLSGMVGEATKAGSSARDAFVDVAGGAKDSLASAAGDAKSHIELPSSVKMLDGEGNVTEVAIAGAGKIIACCGLQPPPMGWYGPFGFFRLVSYAFILASVLGLVLAVSSLSQMDCLGFFSGLLLVVAAATSAAAAFSHEGLANEVTEVAEQNRQYAQKNDRMTKQLEGLGDVANQLESLESSLGVNMSQFTDFLETLHRQTSIQQLATLLRAFCDADRHGTLDERLMKEEVDDFLDDCTPILKGACPTFDFETFKDEAEQHGIGMHAVRFMANALIASSSDNVHTSTALLSLIMLSFSPEKYTEHFLSDMKLACPNVKQQAIRDLIATKRQKKARPDGSLFCRDLCDLQQTILNAQTAPAEADGKGGGQGAME